MPLLVKAAPEIKLRVVGSNPPQSVLELKNENVEIVGYVENLGEELQAARLSVAPLRFGAGLKGKVATSMANGTPVVASGIAVEGMDIKMNTDYLLANSPEDFVRQIFRAYGDATLWNELSINSKTQAESLWGFHAGALNLNELLERLNLHLELPTQRVRFF
jgi:glycosyltransferase involved in cell wall biosynthesis